jgi:ubiquinone/menaquinone biosynthesis C-methylase UbiE
MKFKDHFSKHAAEYAHYRPHYPESLFDFLASLVPEKRIAWDCATGNGQAANGLAGPFQYVIATDPSRTQILHAVKNEKISYCVALAEQTPLQSRTVNLVTIAQALHWLDTRKFFAEVRRILKPDGYFAAWCYNLLHVHPRVDVLLYRFYTEIVGPFWPPERKLLEDGFRTISFPFDEKESPSFDMSVDWDLNELIGYLRTWSSSQKYVEKHGRDPVEEIQQDLLEAWGPPDEKKRVRWPLSIRLGKNVS